MKKMVMAGLLGLSSLVLHAGNMGPVSTEMRSVPYLAAEGSYTWNQIDGYKINGQAPSISKDGGGGRLSVGINRPYTEKFSLNAEVGGGFYGSTTMRTPISGVDSKLQITGYDILAGGVYHMQYINLFGDFGFMAQTLLTTLERDNSKRFPGGVITGSTIEHTTQTQIIPEVKGGVSYNLHNNVSLTLSCLYVFGSTVSGSLNSSATDAGASATKINTSSDLNLRNPAHTSILLGLRYHFV